ncbi:hypothetical protein GIB67_029697, partial [Kingdonia uniflora]
VIAFRDDEYPMELLCRTAKQSLSSKVKKKKSLLNIVAQEGVKLEAVVKELGISRKSELKTDFADVSESTTSSKLALAFSKKRILKRDSTSGTTGSGEVDGEVKKRRVDLSSELIWVKVVYNRPGIEDELKAVEKMARLAVRNGEEEMSKMATRLMKGICLGMEEDNVEPEKGKAELEKKVAYLKTDLAREGKRKDRPKTY